MSSRYYDCFQFGSYTLHNFFYFTCFYRYLQYYKILYILYLSPLNHHFQHSNRPIYLFFILFTYLLFCLNLHVHELSINIGDTPARFESNFFILGVSDGVGKGQQKAAGLAGTDIDKNIRYISSLEGEDGTLWSLLTLNPSRRRRGVRQQAESGL